MGRNTGNGSRIGVTGGRNQTYNEKTGKFIKRDTTTGRFISCKDTPYKGVRRDDRARKKDSEIKETEKQAKKKQDNNAKKPPVKKPPVKKPQDVKKKPPSPSKKPATKPKK